MKIKLGSTLFKQCPLYCVSDLYSSPSYVPFSCLETTPLRRRPSTRGNIHTIQTLATFLSLKARLAEEASLGEADGRTGNDWSRTLTSWCGETSYVQYGGNPPPTFGPEMTIDEYVEIPGVDDIMTKVRICPACRMLSYHRCV